MNKEKKVVEKGFTLHITSWENDGDNYRTKTKTVETKEEAERLVKICKELFKSENNGQGGVGNSMGAEGTQTLIDYVEKYPEYFLEIKFDDNEDEIFDYFIDLGYELMGGSEFYDFRVCEKVELTYSPIDVFVDLIQG